MLYQMAPSFQCVNFDLDEKTLSTFNGKIKIITSLISLETSVCKNQLTEFNQRAQQLSDDIVIIAISNDLPFAQSSFCLNNSIKSALVFSDCKYRSFAINYGVLISELNLLARAVFIIDANNVIRYIQIADESYTPLDYDDVFLKLKEILGSASKETHPGLPDRCIICKKGGHSMKAEKAQFLTKQLEGWQLLDSKKITKEFNFKNFNEVKLFVDLLTVICGQEDHYPEVCFSDKKVKVALWTYTSGGLSDNDFIMARIINNLMI